MEISNVAIFLLTVMIIVSEDVMAKVTMTQSNSEVIVGGTTRILCVTSLPREIYWFHFPAGGPTSGQKEVYAYGRMHSPYKDRFEMEINRTTGTYELVMPRVELTDAGVYSCQEDDGSGDSSQAELTVLEAGPTCTSTKNPIELIGPNSCNKGQENLSLACKVAYRGNIEPVLEWKIVGTNDTVTQGLNVEKTENCVTYHLAIPSQPALDGSVYKCQTTKTRYNCTSDVINVIYVISSNFTQRAMIGDTVLCTAKTNESCSYRWKWFKGDDTLTASNNRTLIPKQSGNFRCEADCFIRKEPCTITAMFAYVEDGNETSTAGDVELGPSYVAPIAIIVVLAVCVVVIIVLLYVFRKRILKNLGYGQTEEKLLMAKNGLLVVESINEIPRYYTGMPFINKGTSGEISGPFVFRDINCACEKILQPSTRIPPPTEAEICDQGKRWMELGHRNVLKFYGVLFESPSLYVVMDYAEGGTVRRALDSCTEDLEVIVVKDWATQIADGMNYLHSKNIVHRRLKCAQVLIMEPFDATNPSPKTLKIASYNLATDGGGQSAGNHFTFQGMFAWMAPETIRGDPTDKPSDVWSYGVTVWEILTKARPFKGVKQAVLIKDLSEGNRTLTVPDRCPDDIRVVLNECWERDKDKRTTFPQIVSRLHAIADC